MGLSEAILRPGRERLLCMTGGRMPGRGFQSRGGVRAQLPGVFVTDLAFSVVEGFQGGPEFTAWPAWDFPSALDDPGSSNVKRHLLLCERPGEWEIRWCATG